ncbi:PROF2 protein, partial [Atractosteus spatula]|nr:PROF2 protein [Atractosteus spatula]
MRCSLLQDNLLGHSDGTMDLRTKAHPSQGVAVSYARRFLLILVGHPGIHGGALNTKAYHTSAYI